MTKSILKSFLSSIFFFSLCLSQEQFSINFSGNSHVAIPSNLLAHDEPRTILAQVKNNGGGAIYSNFTNETGEYTLGVWNNGSIFQLKGSNGNWAYAGDATTTINDEWMYVVAVWDLNQVKLYENDILVGVTDLQGNLAQNTFNGNAGIGVNAAHYNGWYNGKISEVAVWNRALNEQEIIAIINGASVSDEYENLIAYWPFNEGSGNVINDVSGNNNHATLNNGEWSTDVPEIPMPEIEGFTAAGRFNENLYYISNNGGNYFNGLEICEGLGGHLVTITSEEENQFVLQKLMEFSGGSNHLWIGLDDLNQDGNFEWVTGEELSYEKWSSGPATGLAVEMESNSGEWRPNSADDNQDYRRYMLEIESEPIINGCTDAYAANYNSDANVDDGSCNGYPDNGQYSLSFDGEDDFVNIPLSPSLNLNQFDTLSIAALFKINSYDNEMGLLSFGDTGSGITIAISNEGQLMSWFPGYTVGDRTEQLYSDIWYNVIVTYATGETGFKKIYINGELQVDEYYSYAFYPNQNNSAYLGIGDQFNGYEGRYFDGFVGNVTLFNRELRQSEINDSMFDEDGIIGSWNFNSGDGGVLYDRSGNQNHGIINGPSWSEDVYVPPTPPVLGGNNSLIFDGVDDLVQLSQDAFSGETGTLMAWFKPKLNLDNAFDSGKSIYCQGASTTTYATFGVGLRPNSIWLEMGAPGNQIELTNNSFNYDSWNHIAVSFEYGLVNTYMNGSLVSTLQAPDSAISNNGHGAFIGRRGNTSNVDESYSFQGMISHFSSTPYALNQYDILQSMVSDTSFFDGSIWNFNEGEGITLTDLGSNGNDGTIIGATWTGDTPEPLVPGCMDNYAENYNPDANVDNGECWGYPNSGDHSLQFNGIEGSINTQVSISDQVSFTLATWVKINELEINNILISQEDDWAWYVRNFDGIQLSLWSSIDGDGIVTYNEFQQGQWYHLAMIYENGVATHFVNGIQIGEPQAVTLPAATSTIEFGKWSTENEVINANFSSVSILNRAIDTWEMQDIMRNDFPYHNNQSYIGYWPLISGQGDIAYDHSGNANHGMINGPSWSSDIPYNGPLFVSNEGSDDNNGSEESPFATIQKAINSTVQDGNIIFVYPGIYQEKLVLENKDLSIRSIDSLHYDLDSAGVVNVDVIIEGSYDGTVISMNEGSYHFYGLAIRFGRSDIGGGLKLENANLMLENCLIESNQTAGQGSKGAGIYAYNSELHFERSTVKYNNADDNPGVGAGIYFENGDNETSLSFNNSVMIQNNANGGSGGGIYVSNQSDYNINVSIENSIFNNNTTALHGGALYTNGQAELNIYNSEIIGNSAAGEGGGINSTDAHINMGDSFVLWNSAGDTGGGLRFFGGYQSINNTIIANNAAAVEGGGIKFTGSNSYLEFCTIVNNQSSVCAGGIVVVYDQVQISNSIIYGNGAGSLCSIQEGSFDVSFSNIEGGYIGEGNINSNPLFCDADGDNFELAQNSPCILSGNDGANMGAEGVGCSAVYINNALSFDGENDFVASFPEVDNYPWSVFCWFKTYDQDGHIFQISSNEQGGSGPHSPEFYIDDGNLVGFIWDTEIGDGHIYSNERVDDGEWHFAGFTHDLDSTFSFYLDGELIGTLNRSNSGRDDYGCYYPVLGKYNTVDSYYEGLIDELQIWSKALTQEQIQTNMNQELIGYEQDLLGYWNFNEVQDSIAIDITGNDYNGIIYGAQISGDAAPIDPPPTVEGCNDFYAENYDPYANSNDGSCVYSNEPVTFIKEDYADPFMEENQDRITENVWITRNDNNPLYNAAFESYSDHGISPVGTIWASGQTALQTNLDGYKSFREATGGNHRDLPGRIMSMYLVEENIFYDVEFHSWTSNNNGGGFSYTRTLAEINSFDYGPDAVYFEKEDYADWTDSYNQDRITDSTWITRDNQQGIFNAFSEQYYQFNSGDSVHSAPSNTLWAFGITNEVSHSDYKPFKLAVQDTISMIDLPGHTFSLFLITENLYYDVEFHSWTSNNNGGGFSYTRTDQYGNSVTFTKEDYADYSLEQNQDRISDGVWITRSEQHPLINYAQEQNYYDAPILYMNANGSPENTEWAFGRTQDLSLVDYQPWQAAIGGRNPRNAIGRFMSLHIISEDIYFDVVFHSWTCCGDGGGFSYTRMPVENDSELLNGSLSGRIYQSSDSSFVEGAHIIAVAEDNSHSADTFSDSLGYYSLDLIGSVNYYVSVSFEGFSTHNEYLFIAPFEETEFDISLDIMQSALVEGVLTDWYSNAPLVGASVLFAFTNDNNETETIESITDEDGYFMNQVPGEKDYDLFAYADGYWVEHDAFYLQSGEHQVLEIGIAEMTAASRLYGTVKDFETGESIPYAEIQLNCEEASDWDRTGALGTYRVFSYYPEDCTDGVLIVTADGFETSVQSVGNVEFEAGSSYDLDVVLVEGNDPDPGMLSGTVYSNIDGSELGGAEIVTYNLNTTQLFTYETSDDGSFELFLPESDYFISVNAQNHSELLDSLSIISGQSVVKDFYLDQVIEYRISGVVTDQNDNPLSGFETFVSNGNGYRTTYTNENGEYELYVPNGIYDVGSGSNDYFIGFIYGVEVNDNDIVVDIALDRVQEFDGGFAGLVHLNNGDSASVLINVWDDNLTYNAYVSSDASGGFALPLVNGTYTIFASVPNSDYENIYIPNAFTVENNIINYDLYFIAPDGPDAPVIIYLGDIPNDQGGQLELAWTPGDPREFEIFPQYSIWRLEDEWSLIATVPYHGFELYNMVVPTLGDSTSDGIFESTFMVTAHTLDQSVFFDSQPVSGYSIDNIYPAIPQQLTANIDGESVELNWIISVDEDLSYYNVYRQDQSSLESATIFETENNYYYDNIELDGDYQYWVTAVDVSGNESDPSEPAMVTLGVQENLIPKEFALMQNYPNPFNPSTQIMYSLPKTSSVKIVVYDMLGSKVRTLYSGVQDAGYKNVLWNATNDQGDPVSAGMYIYTIESESFFASKKMILLK